MPVFSSKNFCSISCHSQRSLIHLELIFVHVYGVESGVPARSSACGYPLIPPVQLSGHLCWRFLLLTASLFGDMLMSLGSSLHRFLKTQSCSGSTVFTMVFPSHSCCRLPFLSQQHWAMSLPCARQSFLVHIPALHIRGSSRPVLSSLNQQEPQSHRNEQFTWGPTTHWKTQNSYWLWAFWLSVFQPSWWPWSPHPRDATTRANWCQERFKF